MKRVRVLMMVALVLGVVACDDYGTKMEFNGGELYYTDTVTSVDATNLGNYLVEQEFFDGNPKTVQLGRSGSVYEFRMVVKKGMEQDADYLEIVKLMSAELSQNVFGGNQVDIHLCDENLSTLRVVVDI